MILVIANPYSRFAKKDGLKKIEKIIASTKKEVIYVKTSSVEELNGRLIKIPHQDVSAIFPIGGDGTFSLTLTAVVDAWLDKPLPPFIVSGAGTVNVLCRAVHGKVLSPLEILSGLMCTNHQLAERVEIPVLQVNNVRLGFMAGFGVPSRFLEKYYSGGASYFNAVKTLGAYMLSSLHGGTLAKRLFEPTPCEYSAHKLEQSVVTVVGLNTLLASSHGHLPLGFRLSPNSTAPGEFTCIQGACGPSTTLSIPAIYFGRYPRLSGLRVDSVKSVDLKFNRLQRVFVDGDLLSESSELTIRFKTNITFLKFS